MSKMTFCSKMLLMKIRMELSPSLVRNPSRAMKIQNENSSWRAGLGMISSITNPVAFGNTNTAKVMPTAQKS